MLNLPTISILALPTAPQLGKSVVRNKQELVTLDIDPTEQSLPLLTSFEELIQAFRELPRMFCEPDGSFVWVGESPEPWQLDGQLHDFQGKLRRIDLAGTVPQSYFLALLELCGHPVRPVMFELPEEGIFLAEPELRKWITADAG